MQFILAHSRYRRRRLPEAMSLCDQMLSKNANDEAAWMLKCSCLIKENDFDPLETDEMGVGDDLMDETTVNFLANPGTSFRSTQSRRQVIGVGTSHRNAGVSRSGTRSNTMRTGRIMTRQGVAATANGRILRLSTASMEQFGKEFVDVGKMDMKKIAQRKSKGRLIFLYLFYVEHNMRKALELAVYATEANNYNDPWWKLSLGKCYYHMGLNLDAQKQLKSSLKHNCNIESYLYLSKLYQKQDSVIKSIQILREGIRVHPSEPKLNISIARIYDKIGQMQKAHLEYKQAMMKQNCNVQAVANFAAYFYHKDQAQVSAKLYQRLIQLGYNSAELWNNLGLCTFALDQLHLFYSCFQRALIEAKDDAMLSADVWYNIGYIYISLGELQLAIEAFFAALSHIPQHSSALNNIGILYFKLDKIESAINYSEKSYREENNFQAAYNLSLWYMQTQQLQKSYEYNQLALQIYPTHEESLEISKILLRKIDTL